MLYKLTLEPVLSQRSIHIKAPGMEILDLPLFPSLRSPPYSSPPALTSSLACKDDSNKLSGTLVSVYRTTAHFQFRWGRGWDSRCSLPIHSLWVPLVLAKYLDWRSVMFLKSSTLWDLLYWFWELFPNLSPLCLAPTFMGISSWFPSLYHANSFIVILCQKINK